MTLRRAISELRRALEENSVARASILNMRYEGQDVGYTGQTQQDLLPVVNSNAHLDKCNTVQRPCVLLQLLNLYKLHLQNTEMPPNFATLLQLREMLAISEVDAERLEKDVYESGAAFSI